MHERHTMTTTRHIIDITADLVPGFEAEETSEAKNIAYEILELTYVPDSGDAITAADHVVEALIKAGWRPTVEEPAAEDAEGEQDAPTDVEVEAAARAARERWGQTACTGDDTVVWPSVAHAALVAAREAAER